ncbi:tyrosine-protein phosphatase 1-like isoform X7 [Mytilus trossulus]|uniref:tyrosine-protein phosphatase 1-like isoform X7 n=1 Tax=Mytilus trossulus TaxID=6551 RepID=UPI003003AFFE
MVCSATKDSSLMCHDISSQIRRETVSYLDQDEMKSVRFRLRANSHDPSLSDDMCATSSLSQNEMGKIVRPKENKPLSERDIARIKRNKRISRRKDVCKSMPIFLEDDSPESLEDRIKAIVLDTSAKRSKDDDALLQSTSNLDDVIQGRISRGSNITDSEKIYHKLCRRTKSFIVSPSQVIEVKTRPNEKLERSRSRSRSRSVADDKENSKRFQTSGVTKDLTENSKRSQTSGVPNDLTGNSKRSQTSGVPNDLTGNSKRSQTSGVPNDLTGNSKRSQTSGVTKDLTRHFTDKQRHDTKDQKVSKVIIPKSTSKQSLNTKDYNASKDVIPESAKYTDQIPQNIKYRKTSKDLVTENTKHTDKQPYNIKYCKASNNVKPESAISIERKNQNTNNFSTQLSQIVESKFSLTNHRPIKNTKGIQTSDLPVKTIVRGKFRINDEENSAKERRTKETVKTVSRKGINKKSNEDQSVEYGDKLVLRQCQIGSSTVFGLVQIKADTHNSNGYPEGHGLVTIRMIPDEQGRFGFNVKGGADQGMPIIVSRVAPNTPADLAIPRLNEGDQVLYINGRDVSQHTHEQVVMFIRASRETHSGELVLIVRPNVYVGEEQADQDPDLVYIPDSHQITGSLTGANALENSLMLLQESLESGAALAQFDQLYRKKPGMTMNAARLDANIAKNRYRDISPYDQTRVILKGQTDYINANYVNMEIPGSGIVNRYIAAQGPLPATCTDFWQMVWEQHTSLLVMLTMKNERGRVKCHQYWPDMYETLDYGALQITCVKEDESTSFAFREFNLTNIETREERHISHMQYIAWPDHGVPDDPGDFLDFVIKVRERRQGMVEPTVVHCSAGIGRTGVLITMETAMCLVEANQPVYPLSIVRQMRDQRAMLIQTASQYKFVCEAILKVYHEGIVKPEDYQR